MIIDQSKNAIRFAEKFRSASFRLTEDNLKSSGVELAHEIIEDVRGKIEAVDWEHFDPVSKEASDLFPILTAVAATQEEGREFLQARGINDDAFRLFSEGASFPAIYAEPSLIFPLKEIVVRVINRLEERLPKTDPIVPKLMH